MYCTKLEIILFHISDELKLFFCYLNLTFFCFHSPSRVVTLMAPTVSARQSQQISILHNNGKFWELRFITYQS
jgi:hypothetical protein